jgi:hypothetical protein
MGAGAAVTVNTPVVKHVALLRKVTTVVPALIPFTNPVALTVATTGLLTDHVPGIVAVRLVELPAHTLPVAITEGGVFTVTVYSLLQPTAFV